MYNDEMITITKKPAPKPLLLIILDGFGVSLERTGNPVMEAKTPTLDKLWANFPAATLQASGIGVGLPWGKAGNSEVGHLAIGAGKIIYHHLPRIINAIHDGSFEKNPAFLGAIEHVKKNNSRIHILGLCSNGSVHSYREHLFALLDMFEKKGVEKIFVHAFTDGRDSPPQSGAQFLETLERRMAEEWPHARIASVTGRIFPMDRDENWDKIETAYRLLTEGRGEPIDVASEYVKRMYATIANDEYIPPAVVVDKREKPVGVIEKGDAVVFFDFREDSVREIVTAVAEDEFDKFARSKIPDLFIATMTEYKKGLPAEVAFPPLEIPMPLARVLGDAGLSHLHIAETDKYAHITYFLNGGEEKPFAREERILIPSTETSHFDETPAMRAREITDAILERFYAHDVIIANFANADLIGHSGNFQAAVKTVEVLDECLKRLYDEIMKTSGIMVITSDHGNVELKRNTQTGEKLTEHSLNPVPFLLVAKNLKLPEPRRDADIMRVKSETKGILIDVAPTVLDILDIPKPPDMTGKSILGSL